MKIELRLARSNQRVRVKDTKREVSIASIDSVLFESRLNIKVDLFPIPDFIENPVCICNKKGKYLLSDATIICIDCVDKMMWLETRKVYRKDTSIPLTLDVVRRSRFEWSLNGEKWYSVAGKNLVLENPEEFLKSLKDAIIHNKPLILECEYDKETKELMVF